jgi:hypothetical protein
MTTTTTPTINPADCRIWLSGRLMLLCDHHARAIIDLADGNGVKLKIERLEIDDFGSECRACMAAAPPDDDTPQIIVH